MLRRLIQTPAHRLSCNRIVMKQNTPVYGGHSHSGDEAAVLGQLNVDVSPSVRLAATLILPSSKGSEIQGISNCQLSSEVVQSLALGGFRDIFGGPGRTVSEDVMLNPFSNGNYDGNRRNQDSNDESLAFLELFKAISTLNRQPTHLSNVDPWILDIEKPEGGWGSCDQSEDKLEVNDIAADIEVEQFISIPRCENHHCKIKGTKKSQFEGLIKTFEENHSSLDEEQLTILFDHLVNTNLPKGFVVLKWLVERCKERGRSVHLDWYLKLIGRIRSVQVASPETFVKKGRNMMDISALQTLARDIACHIHEEYSEGKEMVCQHLLLPALAVSLLEHSNPLVKQSAKHMMEYILDDQFPLLAPESFEDVLGKATRHTGPEHIPYHRVLSWLISNGHRPKPENVIHILHCYYPFTDLDATHEVLSVIQQLHPDDETSPSEAEDYRVDLGTLETMSMAAAKKNVELILLIWDLVELFGYSPTESMFEDVVMTFSTTFEDENMFCALVDMERKGFVPSHLLLRYVALQVSGKRETGLDHSYNLLTWHENDHVRSTHSMNALMLAYGMKPDINSAFVIFEDLERFDLQPDGNTYTFLMECLYIDTKYRFPYQANKPQSQYNPHDIDGVCGAAQVILDAMEEAEIEKSNCFFSEHVRLLCALGLLEEAKLVLEEAVSIGVSVPMGTLVLLATRFARIGHYKTAHDVAGLSMAGGCGESSVLIKRINNIERKNKAR